MKSKKAKILLILLVVFLFISTAFADDGYRLWLRYDSLPEQNAKIYRSQIKSLYLNLTAGTSADVTLDE